MYNENTGIFNKAKVQILNTWIFEFKSRIGGNSKQISFKTEKVYRE